MIVGCQRKKDRRPTKKDQRLTQILAGSFQLKTSNSEIAQRKDVWKENFICLRCQLLIYSQLFIFFLKLAISNAETVWAPLVLKNPKVFQNFESKLRRRSLRGILLLFKNRHMGSTVAAAAVTSFSLSVAVSVAAALGRAS